MRKLDRLTLIAAAIGVAACGTGYAADPATTDNGIQGVEVNKAPGDRTGVPGVDADVTAHLGKLDKNGDRKISKTEAAGDKELTAQFASLDQDKDGKLDTSEYARFEAKDMMPEKKDKGFLGTDDSTPTHEDKLGPGR